MIPGRTQSGDSSHYFEPTMAEEMERLVDRDKVVKEALRRTEESGIIFLDDID